MLEALRHVLEGKSLTRAQAADAMDRLVEGNLPPEQIGAFLIALRLKRESVDEITGFVDCLLGRSIAVEVPGVDVMDLCGTGGDSSGTFNISTTAAFVVSAAGQAVAKHGNRSISSRSGSFDVLESLGILPETDPKKISRSISDFGLGLIFAPAFHPTLKALAPLRKNMGVPTVFNTLAVLMNPVRVKRQLIGVSHPLLLERLIQVLKARGSHEAMVVHGEDGLDEFSLSAPSCVAHLKGGVIRNYRLGPEDFGLVPAPREELLGGSPEKNAKILLEILEGKTGPKRDVVLMNAAAALMVGGKASTPRAGVALAAAAIDSGAALALLRKLGANR